MNPEDEEEDEEDDDDNLDYSNNVQPTYNDDITDSDINGLIQRVNNAESTNAQLNRAISSFSEEKKDANFLHLQISTEKMLEKLEHFYRGDVLESSERGTTWKPQKNKDLITFNSYGVTSLMEIITKYIDRNTILSYYTEERIYEILGDIGDEMTLFMLCNYQKIGMDTYFKKTKFRIIITTTLHIIESTYRRAIRGKTLEEMNQSRVIGQFGQSPPPMMSNYPKKKNIIERWIG